MSLFRIHSPQFSIPRKCFMSTFRISYFPHSSKPSCKDEGACQSKGRSCLFLPFELAAPFNEIILYFFFKNNYLNICVSENYFVSLYRK